MNENKKLFINREFLLDCNDNVCQTHSLHAHVISDENMDVMIKDWSPIPKTYTGDEVAKIINAVGTSCNYHVSFGDVDFDKDTNEDIDLQVVPGTMTEKSTEYAIILFKGLVSQVQPLTYEFFKGQNNGMNVICFKTTTATRLELSWNMSSQPSQPPSSR